MNNDVLSGLLVVLMIAGIFLAGFALGHAIKSANIKNHINTYDIYKQKEYWCAKPNSRLTDSE